MPDRNRMICVDVSINLTQQSDADYLNVRIVAACPCDRCAGVRNLGVAKM